MRIGIIGTGNMGRAIVEGVVAGSLAQVSAWDVNPAALGKLPREVDIHDPQSWFASGPRPDVVVVAVKPADCCKTLSRCRDSDGVGPDVLWCSVAAGVKLDALAAAVGGAGARVCRVMPNTPLLVGMGASAYCCTESCTERDRETIERVFGERGVIVAVDEKQMDAVTGLSGSGPAYVYLFIEALIEAGITAGIPHETARTLAVQTVRGAAEMVHQGDLSPWQLKTMVTSPAGTTAHGLLALEEQGFKHSVISAVLGAARRSRELGG